MRKIELQIVRKTDRQTCKHTRTQGGKTETLRKGERKTDRDRVLQSERQM